MSNKILLSIILIGIGACHGNILEAELNYQKPKLEHNNVVNKGVWIRNKLKEYSNEKASAGDFIFRASSLDADNVLQNNFDVFDDNNMQDTAFISTYVKRTRRASDGIQTQHRREGVLKCEGPDCDLQNQIEESATPLKSKFINDLKPASVFNDYPYEVAVLINNNDKDNKSNETKNINGQMTEIVSNDFNETFGIHALVINNNTILTANTSSPKRSMKYDFETELVKKFEFTEDVNKTEDSKNDRNVIFDKDNRAWPQNKPINTEVYKVLPKEPPKSKPVTERGLLKVITMLTKTFKKVMKQHNEIKDIYSKLRDTSDDFNKKSDNIIKRFDDFDSKYVYLKKFYNSIKAFEEKLGAQEEYFKTKEREIANSLNEFENTQKKFLMQQRQFYNIQKLMLAQNEKINLKQSLISKTQSEISHRQNTFARILKKAKQMFVDNKNPGATKLRLNLPKPKDLKPEPNIVIASTTTESPSESVKINLFSIPTANKVENHDDLIMKEKDDQPIDDLIYKYYFNNTFIDNLMKSKVLSNFVGHFDNNINTRNAKTKRDEMETTILLPVNDSNASIILGDLNRKRRWVNHHSRHRNRRKNRGKGNIPAINNTTDEKIIGNKQNHKNNIEIENYMGAPGKEIKKDPFVTMAMNFCNELQSNMNRQMLDWCVEKALRKLKHFDTSLFTMPQPQINNPVTYPIPDNKPEKNDNRVVKNQHKHKNLMVNAQIPQHKIKTKSMITNMKKMEQMMNQLKGDGMGTDQKQKNTIRNKQVTELSPTKQTLSTLVTTEAVFTSPSYTVQQGATVFFPDNDELELNLKPYELSPDTDGNVYYDGSLHASDLGKLNSERDSDIDDFIPGFDSNSRLQVDPLAFDVQAQRRAYMQQLSVNMKRSLG